MPPPATIQLRRALPAGSICSCQTKNDQLLPTDVKYLFAVRGKFDRQTEKVVVRRSTNMTARTETEQRFRLQMRRATEPTQAAGLRFTARRDERRKQ
jgi:hypothetical protein